MTQERATIRTDRPRHSSHVHGSTAKAAKTDKVRSLNHLVRTLQQRLRNSQTERLGRLEIDHELEP
jgi:hypothetical protein